MQRRLEGLKLLFVAELAVNPQGIREVVSVPAAGHAPQQGRRIDVRDSKPRKIVQGGRLPPKGKVSIELKPVAGEGNPRRRHSAFTRASVRISRSRPGARCGIPARHARRMWHSMYSTPLECIGSSHDTGGLNSEGEQLLAANFAFAVGRGARDRRHGAYRSMSNPDRPH